MNDVGYTQLNIRLTLEQKAQIVANAKRAGKPVSAFMRDLGLSYGDAGSHDSQEQSEPVAGGAAAAIPVAEPTVHEAKMPDTYVEGGTQFFDADTALAEEALSAEITKLKGQGLTTPVATREAKKRLGL